MYLLACMHKFQWLNFLSTTIYVHALRLTALATFSIEKDAVTSSIYSLLHGIQNKLQNSCEA